MVTLKEFKEDALKNKEKYIGEILIDKYGNIYIVEDIKKEGIVANL